MNSYVTGTTIKTLREKQHMTQNELAELIGVSHKTISKWETAKGLPDITLLEPLAKALGISISSCYELLHEKDFPTLMVGNRMVVPKEDFILWVRRRMGGADGEGKS